MGRIGTDNVTQYHQGIEFDHDQFHHQTQTQESIDVDVPPQDQDLYEPPSDYIDEKIGSGDHKVPSKDEDQNRPQAFPPPSPHYDHHQHHNVDAEKPQAFPPPHRHDDTPQAFPPIHQEDPHVFPPPNDQQSYSIPQPPNLQPQFQPNQQPNVMQQFPTPIQQQQSFPQASPFIPIQNQPWKTELFGCMENPQNAIITLFFPCVTFGQIAEILDGGQTSCGTSGMIYGLIACCIAMPCIMSCSYRSKMRSRFGLIESPLPDFFVHCFCEWCALCQEYQELEKRGIDPSIGWLGNVAKQQAAQQQFVMTAAPMQQRMM